MTTPPWKARGRCQVPMRSGYGLPAGVCGEEAFGEFIPGEEWRDAYTGELKRFDGKFNGYSGGLCCPKHSGPERTGPRIFQDGTDERGYRMWCAVYHDFENLQESPAEFHTKAWIAIRELQRKHPREIKT